MAAEPPQLGALGRTSHFMPLLRLRLLLPQRASTADCQPSSTILEHVSRLVRLLWYSPSRPFVHAERRRLNYFDDYDSDEESGPSKLRKGVETFDGDRLHEEKWNLDATWPHLEELYVFDDPDSGRLPPLTSEIFALLPRSLLVFKLASSALTEIDSSHLATLPPNIERLCLPTIIDLEGLKRLPISITDIGTSLNPLAHGFDNSPHGPSKSRNLSNARFSSGLPSLTEMDAL